MALRGFNGQMLPCKRQVEGFDIAQTTVDLAS
jgi:hypothetical protein